MAEEYAPDYKDAAYIHVRVRDPNQFDQSTLRSVWLSEKKGVRWVRGQLKDSKKWKTQVYLFAKSKKWTRSRARAWVQKKIDQKKEKASIKHIRSSTDLCGNVLQEVGALLGRLLLEVSGH